MRAILILIILTQLGCSKIIPLEEIPEYQDKIKIAQSEVSKWIKRYALYPDSYEPISFSEYSETYSSRNNDKIPNSENYIIKHSHRLLNKDSNMVTFTGYFIMEYDYFVSIIEKERSNATGGAFPPLTEVWTNEFGRPLNSQDSLELKKRNNQVTDDFIKEIKGGFENGNIYTEDPKDSEKLKNILDTLEKENK